MSSDKSVVAVVKTNPENVLADYFKAAELAGLQNALDPKASTILKDNISWHLPFPGANTMPWQLEGAIKALKGNGLNDLVAVHNDTVVTDPYIGGKLLKLKKIYEKYEIPERYNNDPDDLKWVEYAPKAEMLVLKKIYHEGIKIPEFFIGKNIVHLPTVKTHIYTTTTGSMKNAFGGLLNTRRHYTHSVIHQTLVDLLHIQKEIHPGIFAFMDGTTCGSGPGPRTMTPHVKNYILASADQVAIDAVAAKMMGFDPMKLEYIRLAHEHGLGHGRIEEIEGFISSCSVPPYITTASGTPRKGKRYSMTGWKTLIGVSCLRNIKSPIYFFVRGRVLFPGHWRPVLLLFQDTLSPFLSGLSS